MSNSLPKSWEEVFFTEVFDINGGTQPPKSQFINEPKIGYIRLLQIRDFGKKPVPTYIPNTGKLRTCKTNEILIARYGASIGRIVTGQQGAYNVALAKVIIPMNMDNSFVKWLLKSHIFQNKITSFQRTAQSGFNKEDLSNIKIPLPPLGEQQRIVAKLDDLFKRLELIRFRMEKCILVKKDFIYSCLVNSDTNHFHTRQKIGSYLEEGTERIGEGWNMYRKIGVSAKKGIIELSTGQKKTFEKYKKVYPGDFIYNTMRVNIGSIAIYNGTEPAITSPDYVVFRVKNKLSSELLLGFLKSEQGLLEIGSNTKGSVRARLYFKSLANIRMPIGNEETQLIAQKFLFPYSNSIRKLKKISKKNLVELEQSILNKAFKGELVPQLPTDGDARELLKEIKKLKAEVSIKKKTKKQLA